MDKLVGFARKKRLGDLLVDCNLTEYLTKRTF